MKKAENEWVKAAQTTIRRQHNFEQLVKEFNLIEVEGILKCVGRLRNSDLDLLAQRPVILPKEHEFTKLVIEDCPNRVHHRGVRATLTELRSRYWVPQGRQHVKKVIGSCFTCKKIEGRPYRAPPEADLPEFRVREAPPFSRVGVDFAGPLYVECRRREEESVYRVIFLLYYSRDTRGISTRSVSGSIQAAAQEIC